MITGGALKPSASGKIEILKRSALLLPRSSVRHWPVLARFGKEPLDGIYRFVVMRRAFKHLLAGVRHP